MGVGDEIFLMIISKKKSFVVISLTRQKMIFQTKSKVCLLSLTKTGMRWGSFFGKQVIWEGGSSIANIVNIILIIKKIIPIFLCQVQKFNYRRMLRFFYFHNSFIPKYGQTPLWMDDHHLSYIAKIVIKTLIGE